MPLYEFNGKYYSVPDGTSEEETVRLLNEATKPATWDETKASIPGAIDRSFGRLGAGAAAVAGKVLGMANPKMGEELLEDSKLALGQIATEEREQTPKNMNLLQESAVSAATSIAANAPVLAGGVLLAPIAGPLGALGLGTTIAGAQTGVEKFGKDTAYGLSTGRATVHGVIHGLIEKYTEYLPLKFLIGSKGLFSSLFGFLGREVTSEEVATLGQFINDKLSSEPDATLGDLAHQMAITAISTAMTAPVQTAAVKTASVMMAPFIKPDQITPEQQELIRRANELVGNIPPTPPASVVGPGGVVVTPPGTPPATTQTGVEATPTAGMTPPAVNIPPVQPVNLVMAQEMGDPVQEGRVRLYTMVPADGGDQMKGHVAWYQNLSTLQEHFQAIPDPQNWRVPYIDITPEELEASQKTEETQNLRAEMNAEADQYVLPMTLAKVGQYIHNAPALVESMPKVETPAPAPTKKPQNVRYKYHSNETGRDTMLVFPDEWSKQTFLFAQHLDSVEGKIPTPPLPITQKQVDQERVALAQAYDISEAGVPALARTYRNAVAEIARARPGETVEVTMKPVNAVQHETAVDPYEQHLVKAAEYGEVGKVNIVPQSFAPTMNVNSKLVKRSQALLQKWLTLFAPGTKLVIFAQAPWEMNKAKYEFANGVGLIRLPAEGTSDLRAYFVLAHEFGHHLMEMVLNAPQHAEAKARIQAELNQIRGNINNMTAKQYLDVWSGPHRLAYQEKVLEAMGVQADDPAQAFIDAQDALTSPGYSLRFHEYAAEQFARYVGKQAGSMHKNEPKVLELFRSIATEVKNFYEKVVKKLQPRTEFDKWLDGLRAYPEAVQAAETQAAISTQVDDAYWGLVDEQYDYTLKTLNRLPEKDQIRRDTIVQQLKRPDVRQQERELIMAVLNTFDGDIINRAQLRARVNEKIVSLTTYTQFDRYSTYGLSNIGITATDVRARTEVFRLPFEMQQANHFGNDPYYFAHARFFDEEFSLGGVVKKLRSIVELQSDLMQRVFRKDTVSPQRLVRMAMQSDKYADRVMQTATKVHKELQTVQNAIQAGEFDVYWTNGEHSLSQFDAMWSKVYDQFLRDRGNPLPTASNVAALRALEIQGMLYLHPKKRDAVVSINIALGPAIAKALQRRLEELVTAEQEHRIDAKNYLERAQGNVEKKRALAPMPKAWWETLLRKMNSEASMQEIQVMRVGTADLIAAVEGWRNHKAWHLKDAALTKHLQRHKYTAERLGEVFDERSMEADDWAWYNAGPWTYSHIEQDTFDPQDRNFVFVHAEDKNEKIDVPAQNVPMEIDRDLQVVEQASDPGTRLWYWDYGRNQGIYDRYNTEIANFVKKEFGARQITDNVVWDDLDAENDIHDTLETGQVPPQRTAWFEWDVKPNLENIPVEYYDLVESTGQVAPILEDTATKDTPEIPKGFQSWWWFFKQSLKLSQMARLLPNVRQLQVFKRMQEERANMANKLMEPANVRIREWYDLSKKDSVGIMGMLEDEVRGGVHWTQMVEDPTSIVEGVQKTTYAHKMSPKVAEEAKARGVSEKAIQVYLGIKNDYLTSLGHAEDTILNSIDYYFRKNPIVANTRKTIARQLFARLRQQPWLPDRRFGQWVVMIKLKNAEEYEGQAFDKNESVYRAHHRTRRQAEREFSELSKTYDPNRFAVSLSYMEDVQYAMRGMPRKMIESIPEALLLNAEQMDRFKELYYDFSKEGAYLKMLGKDKKRIKGAEQDLRLSYSDYLWRTANLLSKMRYGPRLQHELSSLKRAARAVHVNGGRSAPLEQLHEYMQDNYNYIMRPQSEWESLRALVSMWYLWGVPKSALMNATSLATTAYPRLAAQFGDTASVAALTKAMAQVSASWRDPQKINPEVAALFAQAKKDGVTTQSYAAELAAVKDGNAIERIMPTYAFLGDSGLKDSVRKMTWKTAHFGMLPFRVVEEFNRRVTLLAAYNLEKGLGKAPVTENIGENSAYAAARETVSITQNEYAPWDRAPFLRGKKSVLLIFMSFIQNVSFFMFGGDKGWWRAWLVLMFLAGWQGLPGAENITDFVNWLMRKTMDKPIDLRLEAREFATAINLNPDWVAHGAMHSMFGLGWDTASSVGLGRIIPGTDAIFGQGDANRRIMQMAGEVGGPFGGLTVNVLQALFDDNPSLLLRFDKALPTLIRNLERGYRGAESGKWTDMQGRPVVDDVTGVEVLGQMLGFSPTSKTSEQEERRFQREAAQFYVLRRQNLLSALFQATQAKDSDAIAQAQEKIRAYNDEVPDRQLRITAQDIHTSLRRRERTAEETRTGQPAIRRYRSIYEGIDPLFPERL